MLDKNLILIDTRIYRQLQWEILFVCGWSLCSAWWWLEGGGLLPAPSLISHIGLLDRCNFHGEGGGGGKFDDSKFDVCLKIIFKVRKVQFGPLLSIWANISETVCYEQYLYVAHTQSHIIIMIFQFTLWLLTLDDLKRSNQGHRIFKWLYLINASSYDQSLIEMHIISHIWPFSVPSVDKSFLETYRKSCMTYPFTPRHLTLLSNTEVLPNFIASCNFLWWS